MIDIKVRKAWFLQSSDIHHCQRLYSVSHRGNTQRAMPLFKSDYVVNWAACWATLWCRYLTFSETPSMISNDYEGEYRSRAWKLSAFKGEGDFFYWLKVFIGPKLRQVSKGNFHPKAPKWTKNQAKGSKIHKIRTKWHPTYCGNPLILSNDLLWESTNSVLGATVGIPFL